MVMVTSKWTDVIADAQETPGNTDFMGKPQNQATFLLQRRDRRDQLAGHEATFLS